MNKLTRISQERPAPIVLEHPVLFGNGSRLSLRVIGPGGQPMTIEGWQLYVLFRTMERHILLSSSLSREALLEFARRHKAHPPSWSDASRGENQSSQSPGSASTAMINEEIRSEYNAAEAAGRKPPNIRELGAAVQLLLEQKGFSASKRQIQQLGEAEEFNKRRWPRGKTLKSARPK
jgi:hypothetical protein